MVKIIEEQCKFDYGLVLLHKKPSDPNWIILQRGDEFADLSDPMWHPKTIKTFVKIFPNLDGAIHIYLDGTKVLLEPLEATGVINTFPGVEQGLYIPLEDEDMHNIRRLILPTISRMLEYGSK
jgi:hypothetical protein